MRLIIAIICLFCFAASADAGPLRNFIKHRREVRASNCPCTTCPQCACPGPNACGTMNYPSVNQSSCANGQCQLNVPKPMPSVKKK